MKQIASGLCGECRTIGRLPTAIYANPLDPRTAAAASLEAPA